MANVKSGSIRLRERTNKDGTITKFYEARVTIGYDKTGRQLSKSISGKTKAEVTKKMQQILVDVERKEYVAPCKLTVSAWLDTWLKEFCSSVKPRTLQLYTNQIEKHIKPELGKIHLDELDLTDIQRFYNRLSNIKTGERLSPKSIKNIHGILHKSLESAVDCGYIKTNPSARAKLPKVQQAEIKPLEEADVVAFLEKIKGHEFETVYFVDLFTGMREGEILGLSWDAIDFKKGTITIKQQLQVIQNKDNPYIISTTKNGKSRIITPAPIVMQMLKEQKQKQFEMRNNCPEWDNKYNLVFTNSTGRNLCPHYVYLRYKKIVESIGRPDARFHDLRHTFATLSIRNGDDIKTVQENLGHYTASFTLQVYTHATDAMKKDSSCRMDSFIKSIQTA